MALRKACVGLLTLAALAAPSSAAGAIRLGPDLTQPPGQGVAAFGCQPGQYSPCSYVNHQSTNSAMPFVATSRGVITKWRVRAGCCTENQTEARTLTLKTFKQGSWEATFPQYAFIVPANTGDSFVIPAGNQLPSDPPLELPTRLPIAAGERIGVVADYPIGIAAYNSIPNVTSTVVTNGTYYPPGQTPPAAEAYGAKFDGIAMAINADVEPDADGDEYGDETQDCSPSDPAKHGDCAPPAPSPTPVTPPPVYVPGGGCTGVCGGGGAAAVFAGPISPPPAGDGSVIFVPVKCPAGAVQPCGGFLIVTRPVTKSAASARPKPLGRVRYLVQPGQTKKVKLKLTKAGRKLLKKKRKLRVVVTIDPNEGDPVSITRTLRWRPKRSR